MIWEWVIIFFLLVWFILSVLFQIESIRHSKFFNIDLLGIIPSFRFFAPHPVSQDLIVYARGKLSDEHYSNWFPLHKSKKGKFSFIWNPVHRERKAIYDLYEELEPFRETPKIWHVSSPYIILLNRAQDVLRSKNEEYKMVQFCIACYAGYEDQTHEILFLSNEHELDS